MRWIKAVLGILLTAFLIILLNNKLVSLPILGGMVKGTPAESLPAIAPFLNPFTGVWTKVEGKTPNIPTEIQTNYLKDKVEVIFDDRLVPHIYAQNEEDLFFAQGYVTAAHRLWQMEFITIAAAGQVASIIGPKALDYDKAQRRKGMLWAAKIAIDKYLIENPLGKKILEAYTAGVNAYIEQLSDADLPIEYRLMGYKPSKWTPLHSALLLKQMTWDLASRQNDVPMTNALEFFSPEDLAFLFPDYPQDADPVAATTYNAFHDFQATKDSLEKVKQQEEANQKKENHKGSKASTIPDFWEGIIGATDLEDDEYLQGSNNWAVAGSKTQSGQPILCSDPHLRLRLPAIWYEIQLNAPGINVYGVSIPGGPAVTIGFNDNIAWGVTNSGRDVMDWYQIRFKDDTRQEYWVDSTWKKTDLHIEEIKVKGGETIYDTLFLTQFGPVANYPKGHEHYNMARKWKGHEPSLEMLTFYYLNKAQNYEDYLNALKYYECPAQNFAFAAKDGDIAIWQQGKFPLLAPKQGQYVQDGTQSSNNWQDYIPIKDNPHDYNPARNFVSSANQHPTDSLYPYYYGGRFEYFRNRRLNDLLAGMENITPDQMKKIQTDNYHLFAKEVLEVILPILAEKTDHNEFEQAALKELQAWDFNSDHDKRAPSVYKAFWHSFYKMLWDDLKVDTNLVLPSPHRYHTLQFMKYKADHDFMDYRQTPEKENLADLVKLAFVEGMKDLEKWEKENGKVATWQYFRGSTIQHIGRIPAFGVTDVPIGGDQGILNAMNGRNGDSWRMVVHLKKDGPEAWGIYPGGQSGNPASPYYKQQIPLWAKGEYYPLNFWSSPPQEEGNTKVLGKMIMQ